MTQSRPYLEMKVKVWRDNSRTDFKEKVVDTFGDEDYLNLKPVDHCWIHPSNPAPAYTTLVVYGTSPALVRDRYVLMSAINEDNSP